MPKFKNQRYQAGSGLATLNITFPFVVKSRQSQGTFMCHVTCRKWVSDENLEGRIRVSTGLQHDATLWGRTGGAFKSANVERIDIENQLQAIVRRLQEACVIRSADAKKRPISGYLSPEEVARIIKGKGPLQPVSTLQLITGELTQKGDRTYGGLFELFMKEYRGDSGLPLSGMHHHQKNFQTLGYNLLRFTSQQYGNSCTLDFLSDNLEVFGTAWKHYLIHERNFSEESIHANMKRLKTLLTFAMKRGYLLKQELDVFDFTPSRDPFLALDTSHVWRLIRAEFTTDMQRLERVRDLFVILCLTGLRFSDLHKLPCDDLESRLLLVPTSKQGVVARIPLFPELKKMLLKYPSGLPVLSNQKFNTYLKEVLEYAGLTEQISVIKTKGNKERVIRGRLCDFVTSHTGRRTLISCCRTEGIDDSVIMQITTHRTSRQIDDYTSITDRSMVRAFGGSFDDESQTTEPLYTMTPTTAGE